MSDLPGLVYQPMPGDTCQSVAEQFGVTPYMISNYNAIPLYGEIIPNLNPGQPIMIPDNSQFSSFMTNKFLAIARNLEGLNLQHLGLRNNEFYKSYTEQLKDKTPRLKEVIVTNRDSFGGRNTRAGIDRRFEYAGHQPLTLIIKNGSVTVQTVALRCSSFSEQRANIRSFSNTNAGYYINRLGSQPVQLSFSCFFIDIKNQQEKHEFINKYKAYIEDKRDDNLQHFNEYVCYIQHQGNLYVGELTNISIAKQASRPYLYNYDFSFVALKDLTVNDENVTYNAPLGTVTIPAEQLPITEKYVEVLKDPYNTAALKTMNYVKNLVVPYAV